MAHLNKHGNYTWQPQQGRHQKAVRRLQVLCKIRNRMKRQAQLLRFVTSGLSLVGGPADITIQFVVAMAEVSLNSLKPLLANGNDH